MLKVLGSKRVAFLLLVSGVSLVIGYFYYDFLLPMHEKSSQELQTSKSAVQEKYAEVTRLKEEYVLLQSQLRDYKELEARGFFNDQDRSVALDDLDKLSKYAGLLKAKLKFDKGQLIADPVADKAGQVVLKSPVSVDAESMDDVDVYSFIKFIEEKFPGRIDLSTFSLSRKEIFDTAILRKIGGGSPTALVDAKLTFDWFTMSPKNVVAPSENSTPEVPK